MGNIIAGLVVLLIVFLAARKIYVDKKNGRTCSSCGNGCGGSCGHCSPDTFRMVKKKK